MAYTTDTDIYKDLSAFRICDDAVVTTSTITPLPNHVYYISLIENVSKFGGKTYGKKDSTRYWKFKIKK